MSSILLGCLSSVIGVLTGWGLTQAGNWLAYRRENHRTIKMVLFNLLNTYNLLLKVDIEKALDTLADEVVKFFPEEQVNLESKALMKNLYASIGANYLKTNIGPEVQEISITYEQSIKKYAEIDPFGAFSFSGGSSVLAYIHDLETYLQPEINSAFDGDEMKDVIKQASKMFKPNLQKRALEHLEIDVIAVAKQLGRRSKREAIKTIKLMKDKKSDSMTEEIREFLNEMQGELSNYQAAL